MGWPCGLGRMHRQDEGVGCFGVGRDRGRKEMPAASTLVPGLLRTQPGFVSVPRTGT